MCRHAHVPLRMFIIRVLASQLPFLAHRNTELAIPPLFWPVSYIKIGEHVTLLSDSTVNRHRNVPVQSKRLVIRDQKYQTRDY